MLKEFGHLHPEFVEEALRLELATKNPRKRLVTALESHAKQLSSEISEYLSAMGRKGGRETAKKLTAEERVLRARLGGKSAASRMTPAERSDRASQAAKARWARLERR